MVGVASPPTGTVESARRLLLKDIFEVLHKKQAQREQLRQQIEALQLAAKDMDLVRHLLDDEDPPVALAHKAGN